MRLCSEGFARWKKERVGDEERYRGRGFYRSGGLLEGDEEEEEKGKADWPGLRRKQNCEHATASFSGSKTFSIRDLC